MPPAPLLLILLLAPTFAPPPRAPTTARTRRIEFTECNTREPDRHRVSHRRGDNRLVLTWQDANMGEPLISKVSVRGRFIRLSTAEPDMAFIAGLLCGTMVHRFRTTLDNLPAGTYHVRVHGRPAGQITVGGQRLAPRKNRLRVRETRQWGTVEL